jgi:sialate O-acetylesterase
LEFAGHARTTTADDAGSWLATLDSLSASTEARDLTAVSASGARVILHDVLVGDVWLCSGQSNMNVPVRNVSNGDAEVADAKHSLLRFFQVEGGAKAEPQPRCGGVWEVCSPVTAGKFSGVGYFFGRELQKSVNVPIGLIQAAVGSSAAEAWASKSALSSTAEFRTLIGKPIESEKAKRKNAGDDWANVDGDKNMPASLFNGMIAPLRTFGIRGAIWYQGENNANDAVRAEAYRRLLPLLASDWRKEFQQDFPFYIVQLANFSRRGDKLAREPWGVSLWSVLRESQALAASTLLKSGLVVSIDIGDAKDIHPKNKQEVGRRLALVALAKEYGHDVECSGPVCTGMEIDGATVVLSFTHADGLAAKGGALTGFCIAGSDGRFQDAEAVIKGTTVRVSAPSIRKPVAVRYAWSNNPTCNLVNASGLPASPFRFPMK